MDVVAFDVRPDPALAGAFGFRYVDLEDLFAVSDVITLHIPSLPDTRHILGGHSRA